MAAGGPVHIDWFRGYEGGQNLYAGKALRKERQLGLLTQGMYDVGTLLRKQRSQGLPPGWTDEDLANEERVLESELQNSQAKAQQDTTHGVERATTEGDPQGADAIKNDPAGYASTKHEESQGFLPKLGEFMKTGAERLFFGDPRRRERISHIQQMKGTLAAEKDRENFAKNVGTLCMKTEDPKACLRAMGGERFGLTDIPKMAQKKPETPVDPYAPEKSIGGGMQNRIDMKTAEDHVRQRHGGTMPADPDVAAREVREEYNTIVLTRQKAKDQGADERRRKFLDYSLAARDARAAERDARKAALAAGTTVSETTHWWKGLDGKNYQLDDTQVEEMNIKHPGFLTKTTVTIRRKVPERPASERPAAPSAAADEDVGKRDYDEPFYAP